MDSKKFHNALKRVFASEEGKILSEGLWEIYVDSSALADTPEKTYYKLGQKELIQGLLKDASLEDYDVKIKNGE